MTVGPSSSSTTSPSASVSAPWSTVAPPPRSAKCHLPPSLPPSRQVCVEQCPDQTTSLYAYAIAKSAAGGSEFGGFDSFDFDFQRSFCKPDLTDDAWDNAKNSNDGELLLGLIKDRKCPAYTLESISLAGRCVPDFGIISGQNDTFTNTTSMTDQDDNNISNGESITAGEVFDSIKAIIEILNLQEFAEKILSDLIKAKWMLLAGLGISEAVSSLPLSQSSSCRPGHLLPLDLPDEVHRGCDDLAVPLPLHWWVPSSQ